MIDRAYRQQALMPDQSFIIQAPAGSGKTELLTQRVLNLLAHLNTAPEQILALTFTNKAASEMRHRIHQALIRASDPTPPKAEHERQTWQLAKNALLNDEKHQWGLLNNPGRLNVRTIDSFCQLLLHKMCQAYPLFQKATPSDDPWPLYEQAIDWLLKTDDALTQASLQKALLYLDNQLDKFYQLMADLLAQREQWLPLIIDLQQQKQQQSSDTLKKAIQQGFDQVGQDALDQLAEALDLDNHQSWFESVLIYTQGQLNSDLATTNINLNCDISNLANWQLLIDLLFTTGLVPEPRSRFTKNNGIPPGKNQIAQQYKQQLTQFCQDLATKHPNIGQIVSLLRHYMHLTIDQALWDVIDTITYLAYQSVGYLTLAFEQNHQVDFTAVALNAVASLGDATSPTDLALYLDYQIQHILVDEFQDTSVLQYQLLKKLTLEWQPTENKTLFIVGDPMQSIYRFRQAEVNLFLTVRDHGMNHIKLTYLPLQANFRSTPALVEWVNDTFVNIFPQQEIQNYGAIAFNKATAINQASESKMTPDVDLQRFADAESEAKAIVVTIQEHLDHYPDDTIAILVRTRAHAASLIPMLQANNIPIAAHEVYPLYHYPGIRCLASLTFILDQPTHADMFWFALLQSELFGWTTDEVLTLRQFETNSLFDSLCQLDQQSQLAQQPHGAKAKQLCQWLQDPLFMYGRSRLIDRLWCLWEMLDAIGYFPDDFQRFRPLLERFLSEDQTTLTNPDRFIAQLQTQPAPDLKPALVQVLTIHASKGLEFDFVILPQLHRSPRANRASFFIYDQYYAQEQEHFLLSPMQHVNETASLPPYQIIDHLKKQRDAQEYNRLFYVATTRAKSRLLLTDSHGITSNTSPSKNSFSYLLPSKAWREIEMGCQEKSNDLSEVVQPKLTTITNYVVCPLIPKMIATENAYNHPDYHQIIPTLSALQGTILHAIFERVIKHPTSINQLEQFIEHECHDHGLTYTEHHHQLYQLARQAIQHTQGSYSWMFQTNAITESPLVVLENGQAKHYIPDVILRADDHYYLVDYKFIFPSKEQTIEQFSQEIRQQYQAQLYQYRRYLRKLVQVPIRLAIYLPLVPNLIEL